jgi:predicted transcriptional regulator
MTTKEIILDLVRKLPDNCSLDDIQYHIYVLQAIERGQADVAQGKTITHEELKQQLRSRWLNPGAK